MSSQDTRSAVRDPESQPSPAGRDGRTPETALLTPALEREPSQIRYFVNHLGQWLLATFEDARSYTAMGFPVYNNSAGMPGALVREGDWNRPAAAPSTEDAFSGQNESIEDAHDQLEQADASPSGSLHADAGAPIEEPVDERAGQDQSFRGHDSDRAPDVEQRSSDT